MPTYAELLRDPRWQRKRLQIMNRANFRCEECGADDKTLNVHHRLYRKGAKPWEYDDRELKCLCEECHQWRHDVESAIRGCVDYLDRDQCMKLLGYAECLAKGADETLMMRGEWHALGVAQALSTAREVALECLRILDKGGRITPEIARRLEEMH